MILYNYIITYIIINLKIFLIFAKIKFIFLYQKIFARANISQNVFNYRVLRLLKIKLSIILMKIVRLNKIDT